jgi:two-component system sensor histidine kinase KdpD
LQALVNNLLESAIIDSGVFRLRIQPVHLREVLQDVVGMMSPLLVRRQQQMSAEISDEVPATIQGDKDRLKQALVNLIENASKFSPAKTSVTLRVEQDVDTLTFTVSDCGPGLPAEHFESLFSRFFTGANQGAAQYGIGLGLPIVKAIAEAHGGQVGAANHHEGGAEVWFTIPLRQQVVEESND